MSIPIISLLYAVQLAVGSYGWWRACKRSRSLISNLDSSGANLVPVNSFHMPKYLNIRKDCAVRGISIIYGDAFGGDLPIKARKVAQVSSA